MTTNKNVTNRANQNYTFVCKKVPNMDIISQNIKGSNIRASTNNLEAVKRVLMKFQLYTKTNIIYKK